MMTCGELEVILCDYIDGTLSSEVRERVEQHMHACAACAELAADCGAMAGLLSRVPEVIPPPAAVTRILQQIPARQPASARARGFFATLLGRWIAPVAQPRMVMGMAMTILSFAMLGRFAGIEARQIRPADVNPVRVVGAAEDQLHRAWTRAVKYYDNLRVVFEIQSRLRELTATDDAETEQQNTQQTKPEPAKDKDSQGGQTR